MMSKHFLISTFQLFFSIVFIVVSNIPATADTFQQIKSRFPDSEVAIQKATITIEYKYNRIEQRLEVLENRDLDYVTLKSGNSFVDRIYYDEHTEIEKVTIKNAKGKKVFHDKYCGHYESDGIFYSDAQVCAYNISQRSAGDKTYFYGKIVTTDPRYFTRVFFHDAFPIHEKKVIFKIPSWVNAEVREYNFSKFDIEKTVDNDSDPDFTIITYKVNNLDSFKDEENTPGISKIYPHLVLLTKSYVQNGKQVHILENTDDLYAWYKSLVYEIHNNRTTLIPVVETITEDLTSDEDKIEAIYNWVQDNIKYIAFEDGLAGFKPENADKVLYNRYGDCKGMSNLMKQMLIIAGFDARLTWVGTDALPYDYDLPSLAVDNHMICSVKLDGAFIPLDATDKYQEFMGVPAYITGKEMMIEDGDAYIIKKIGASELEKNKMHFRFQSSIDGDVLKSSGETKLWGEVKKFHLNLLELVKPDKKEELIKFIATNTTQELDNVNVKSGIAANRDDELAIQYDLRFDDRLTQFGNDTYLEIDYFKNLANLDFDEDRSLPYDFRYEYEYIIEGETIIPPHLQISYLPEKLEVSNELLAFTAGYNVKDNKIFYSKKLKIRKRLIQKDEFEVWNKAIKQLNTFYNDQVILTSQ